MKSTAPHPGTTYIFPKDVIAILTHISSYDGAWAHLRKIKDSLGKKKHQRVTAKEFAEWEGIDVNIVMERIAS